MIRFGATSEARLAECHPKIQRLLREVANRIPKALDFSVICGHRGEADQDAAYLAKRSTKRWPESLHNMLPSPAVDVAPYPIDWGDTARFARLAGYIQAVADDLGIEIRWGGDWNSDGRTADERFVDMPHIELTTRERGRP